MAAAAVAALTSTAAEAQTTNLPFQATCMPETVFKFLAVKRGGARQGYGVVLGDGFVLEHWLFADGIWEMVGRNGRGGICVFLTGRFWEDHPKAIQSDEM